MKLPEMPSYPYIGQDWDDTARLLLEDWGKACYVAGKKQERALWELTKAGEALGEPAATPVVPPSGRKSIAKLLDLVADYWNLAHAEGREQRTQDTEDGAASAKWNEIRTEALTLAASPSPRTPEQPEQRPDSDHPVGEQLHHAAAPYYFHTQANTMNATTFTPDAGTLFYVRSTLIRERVVGGGLFGDSSTATVIKERDESYSGDIFECAGSDDTAVVGIRKTPGYGDARKQVFKRDRWAFSPVGPEVASAMFAQPSETSPSGAILSGSDSVEHSTE